MYFFCKPVIQWVFVNPLESQDNSGRARLFRFLNRIWSTKKTMKTYIRLWGNTFITFSWNKEHWSWTFWMFQQHSRWRGKAWKFWNNCVPILRVHIVTLILFAMFVVVNLWKLAGNQCCLLSASLCSEKSPSLWLRI